MSLSVSNVRKDFPNLSVDVRGKPLVYLDNAATTFKPLKVIERINAFYRNETANVHRGVHFLSEQATLKFEKTRESIKNFINADKVSEIIFTKGTTEAINLVVQCYGRQFLQKGDEILISTMEHHSNIVPWQMLCQEKGCVLRIIPINDQGEIILEEFEKLVNDRTKFISIVHTSNSLGTINPIKHIIQLAHKFNIPVLVDGAQAIGHQKIDIQALDCDFFAFSGHKLFGPTGIGVLYGKASLLNQMPPYQGGGDMIASVSFEKTTYNILPYKFEAGTPNIVGVIGLGAAIEYIQSIGYEFIQNAENELLDYGRRALQDIPKLKLIGTAKDKTSIFSFVFPQIHAHDLGTLIDEDGVAIRTGHHCTQPVMKRFNISATSRASLCFYNTKEEIDRLVKAILKAKQLFD